MIIPIALTIAAIGALCSGQRDMTIGLAICGASLALAHLLRREYP